MIANRDPGVNGAMGRAELNRVVAPLFQVLDQLDGAGQALAAIKLIEALEILVPGDQRIADRCGFRESDWRGPDWLAAPAPAGTMPRISLACAGRG